MPNRQKLTLASYTRPGTIIGQAYNPTGVNLGVFPRIPTFIGKGVPYLVAQNLQIVRAFINREKLIFSQSAPFQATLAHKSNGSQLPSGSSEVKLYNGSGVVVDPRYWKFTKSSPSVTGYDQVQVFSRDYNAQDTYYIDYQSIDNSVKDQLPVSGLRSVRYIGDNRFEDFYKDGVDVAMFTTIGQPVPSVQVGQGTIHVHGSSDYKSWNKNYTLTVENFQTVTTPTIASAFVKTTGTGAATSLALNATTSFTGVAPDVYQFSFLHVATTTVVTDPTTLGALSVGDAFLVPSAATGAWAGQAGKRAVLQSTPGGVSGAWTFAGGDWMFDTNIFDIQVKKGAGFSTAVTTVSIPLNGSTAGIVIGDGIVLNLTNPSTFSNTDVYTLASTNEIVDNVELSWYNDDYQSSSGFLNVKSGDVLPIALDAGIMLDLGKASQLVYKVVVASDPVPSSTSADLIWYKMLVAQSNIVSTNPVTASVGDKFIVDPNAVATGAFVGMEGQLATYVAGLVSSANSWTFTPGYAGRVTVPVAFNSNVVLVDGIEVDVTLINLSAGDSYSITAIAGNPGYAPKLNLARLVGAQSGLSLSGGQVYTGTIPGSAFQSGILDSFVIGDSWTIQAVNTDSLDWNFTRTAIDSFTPSDIYYDAVGLVTGVPRSYYLTLSHIPTGRTALGTLSKVAGTGVNADAITLNGLTTFTGKAPDTYTFRLSAVSGTSASVTWTRSNDNQTGTFNVGSTNLTSPSLTGVIGPDGIVLDFNLTGAVNGDTFQVMSMPGTTVVNTTTGAAIAHKDIAGKPYVMLGSRPLTNVSVTYNYQNAPQVGQTYYTTVYYTRPASFYQSALIFTSYTEALAQVGYPSPENHLGIMLDYAFNVAGSSIVAVVQVADTDHDGVYTRADFQDALNAAYAKRELTDIVVLSKFDSLADQMENSQRSNDPLYGALRVYWMGFPSNYSVGTPETVGSIAYTASSVLQSVGESAARGTFIPVANQWVKRTIRLESGSSQQVKLDGSFFAGMLACLQTQPQDPNTILLNKAIPGIDAAATFTDTETIILGTASCTYATQADPAQPVVKVIDIVTSDSTADNYHEVNVVYTKQYVTKRLIKRANDALIGYIPLSSDDAVNHVRSVLARELTSMVGEGIIGAYTDNNGRPRSINSSDIDVWPDDMDKTRMNFTFFFQGRYAIKRLTGMFAVDNNIFAS